MFLKHTQSDIGTSDTWQRQWKFWRIQVKIVVYRHRHSGSSDRWVFQPHFIYDRK